MLHYFIQDIYITKKRQLGHLNLEYLFEWDPVSFIFTYTAFLYICCFLQIAPIPEEH